MFEDDDSVFAAMRAGASGYLIKGAQQDEIIRAIQSVAAGQAIFGPTVARRIITFFSSGALTAPTTQPFPELTAREREVLDLIANGRSNTAIAQKLVISTKTVSNHISAIFTKLQVADRAQAADGNVSVSSSFSLSVLIAESGSSLPSTEAASILSSSPFNTS